MIRRLLPALVAIVMLLPALSVAQKSKNPPPPPPKPKIPKMIYISDFDLDFVTPEDGPKSATAPPAGGSPLVAAPQAKLSNERPPKWNDPAARAQHIVGLMATGVVDGISKNHLPARRLFPGDPMPTEGVLLRGVFVESGPSNHFRRVAMGSAPGATQMLLLITLTDLALPDQPLYHFAKDDGSFPGPGALIALNPKLTIIKFDMDRSLSDKVVNKTASQVAKEISNRINPAPPD
jgi:uncharacterized protein DUF4410